MIKDSIRYKNGKATRLYRIWGGIRNRCKNSNNPDYKHYGGRGIKVCDVWNNFDNFYNWAMSNRI